MTRPAYLVFALAVSLFAQTPADPPLDGPAVTFRSDVSLVRVDAQVLDHENRPITGLQMEDFILREDGKQQEIRNFMSENIPVDVLLLLDVSRSMEPHVQRIAAAANKALRVLGDQDRIAIMVFDRSTRVRLPFRNSRPDAERELQLVLDQETFEGGTDITRALLDAADYMARNTRRDARRAIVILTDGQRQHAGRGRVGVRGHAGPHTAALCAVLLPAGRGEAGRGALYRSRALRRGAPALPRGRGSLPALAVDAKRIERP